MSARRAKAAGLRGDTRAFYPPRGLRLNSPAFCERIGALDEGMRETTRR